MKKDVFHNIFMQLAFALGSAGLCAAVIACIVLFSANGIEAFVRILLMLPIPAFISAAVSAAVLKERDIYFPIMLIAAVLCSVYLVGSFGLNYFPFAALLIFGFLFGYFTGKYLGNKKRNA